MRNALKKSSDAEDDDDDYVSIQKYFEYSKRKIRPDINSLRKTFLVGHIFFSLYLAFHSIFHINPTEAKRATPSKIN